MCGIFGVSLRDADRVPDADALRLSVERLRHRGPDSDGTHVAPGVGLAHTRLSLLDLNPRSDQPLWDASGRRALVYNGEVYNHRELRQELERDRVSFRTTSDTEVVLAALVHLGVDETLSRLEGMFAFAFFDGVRDELVVARDRFGIKPLLVSEREEGFYFASELAAFRPWFSFEVDAPSVSSYLLGHEQPTRGPTLVSGVEILDPGTVVIVRRGRVKERRSYAPITDLWDPDEAARLRGRPASELVDLVEERLLESVRSQLIADAPVGAYCSGGVDSSLIMAMAARTHRDLAIFHANVMGRLSELDAATALARHLDLELRHVDVPKQAFVDWMPEVIRHYGHPFTAHSNSVPFFLVSRLVKQHGVKGVLSGEGSDECYLGYSWMRPSLARLAAAVPAKLVARLRGDRGGVATRGYTPSELAVALHARFDKDQEFERIRDLLDGEGRGGAAPRDLKTLRHIAYHLRTLLHRNDSLGMAASVEARFPFLDSRLVRLAVNLPYDVKLRWSRRALLRGRTEVVDKWIVREVASRYLPPELSRRRKQGFSVDAYRGARYADDLFFDSFAAEFFGLTRDRTRFLIDHAPPPFRLRWIQLNAWADIFLRGESLDALRGKLQASMRV